MPVTASVLITVALVAYSVGVWSERLAGRLKRWHLGAFFTGLAFDTLGTGLMFEYAGGMTADLHGVSGTLAIVLMAVHAVWATVVLRRKDERAIVRFHRFSVMVWCVWLVPFLSPMLLGTPRH